MPISASTSWATCTSTRAARNCFYEGRSFRKADVAASVADAMCGLLRPGPARDVR